MSAKEVTETTPVEGEEVPVPKKKKVVKKKAEGEDPEEGTKKKVVKKKKKTEEGEEPAEEKAEKKKKKKKAEDGEEPSEEKKKKKVVKKKKAEEGEEPADEKPEKKKKKKKTEEVEESKDAAAADDEEEPVFSVAGKKKKKKAVEPKLEAEEEEAPGEPSEEGEGVTAGEAKEEEVLDEDPDFSAALLGKKKKKKKAVTEDLGLDETKELGAPDSAAWQSSDRDYNYTELLERIYALLREKNPALGSKKRYTLPPPQMVRVGTKKTMWSNFGLMCSTMHRSEEHVQSFLLAELGTEGSIDGSHRLVIKGKYTGKQIESLLKQYIAGYVQCSMCRSAETALTRDSVTRLYFIQCESCGSRRSVAPIKTGYHAQTKAERRKIKMAS